MKGHTNWVSAVSITSDNSYIISCSYDTTIREWTIQEKMQKSVLNGRTSKVHCLALTSDNMFIVSGGENASL